MLILELYSYVLEIPNNGYTTLKSYWLSNTQSRVLQADWLVFKNNEMATFNITMPYHRGHRGERSLLKKGVRLYNKYIMGEEASVPLGL